MTTRTGRPLAAGPGRQSQWPLPGGAQGTAGTADIRFDLAKSLLDQGHTATRTALLAGFPSYESLHRVFVREVAMSPAAYQRRFGTTRRDGRPPARGADGPEAERPAAQRGEWTERACAGEPGVRG